MKATPPKSRMRRHFAASLALAALISAATACGHEDVAQKAGTDNRRDGTSSDNATAQNGPKDQGNEGGSASTESSTGSATNSGDSSGAANGAGSSGGETGSGGPSSQLTGKQFFLQTVSATFTTQCASCHADPRENPPLRGPLTIFSYASMRALLVSGATGAESGLIQKMRGFIAHGGGDRCHDRGLAGSPCAEVLAWRVIEAGADSGLAAALTSIDATGAIQGFAALSTKPDETLSVKFYADGGRAKGETAFLTLTADQVGANGGITGAHAFKGNLPAALCNGQAHQLEATTEIDGEELPLAAPKTVTAYTPTAAGKKFFTASVAPAMQSKCGGCHVVDYATQYGALISPAPSGSGTATNNSLINHPSGAVTHSGGNVCGGASGSPCSLFQQWWALEFP